MNHKISILLIIIFSSIVLSATILIDPGHGGEENGAISSVDGSKEKDLVMELSFLIRNHLLC